jgi:hypothetical protein
VRPIAVFDTNVLFSAVAWKGKPFQCLESARADDVGTVVHIHGEAAGYEVEFMTLTGRIVAVATVLSSQLRPVRPRDLTLFFPGRRLPAGFDFAAAWG